MEQFYCTGIFESNQWVRWNRAVVSNTYRVETIDASRMAWYRCLSSHLSAVLYNLLMFSRHMCSYIALLLKYWSIPMVAIYCFIQYDCNNPFKTTHCCSNDSIPRIERITLVNELDLLHCAEWAYPPSIWKQRYSLKYEGSFKAVVEVEELICYWRECTLGQTRVVAVFVSDISGVMWFCFLGVAKECVSSSFLPSVSTYLVVVRCDMGDGWL